MTQNSLLSEILRSIAGKSRRQNKKECETDLISQCQALLDEKSEAAGLALADEILDHLHTLQSDDVLKFFELVADEFGVNDEALHDAIKVWVPGDTVAARRIHFVAEPRSQMLIRMLNSVPGGTKRLVALRGVLLEAVGKSDSLKGLDDDFRHLFLSWFNRGFLEIRRIDWSTQADILEKIIQYEAVHEIKGWDDLRRRVGDQDRRLFAFFHPAMPSEPLIFVEVALTKEIPTEIRPILSRQRERLDPQEATTAVFYSISNCQKGLSGISFGNFLIKQVVAELRKDLPELDSFVTLSPIPNLRVWAEKEVQSETPQLPLYILDMLRALGQDERPNPDEMKALAAFYLTKAKMQNGRAFDPVANFHLGNGAMLNFINPDADPSVAALMQSWGAMVNYSYDGPDIESNHHNYTNNHVVTASSEINAMADVIERGRNLVRK